MGYAALFSGGKDSMYALYISQQAGVPIDCIITMLPDNPESYMFHSLNAHLTELHSRSLGIRLIARRTSGEKEVELAELKDVVKESGATGIIVGAIASSYQMKRVEAIAEELGIPVFTPLWHRDEETILREIIAAGFECIFVSVSAEGLVQDWLGRRLDEGALRDLLKLRDKYGINISGEGGEYETLTLDGPNFSGRIEIAESEKTWKGGCGSLAVKKARVVRKHA